MAKAPRFVKYPQLVLSCSQIRVILHKWTFTPSQLLSEVLVPIRSWSTWASSGQWKGWRWFMEKQPAISFGKIWEVCSEYICIPSGLVLLPVPALKAWSLQCPQSTLTIIGLTPGPTLMYRVLLKFTSPLNSAAFLQSSLCLPTCQHLLDHWKSKKVPEKHLFMLYWLCQSLWLCGSQ